MFSFPDLESRVLILITIALGHLLLPRLQAQWPVFGSSTGWRLEGGYEPMEEEVRAKLERMYAPFNARLEEILGRKLAWK